MNSFLTIRKDDLEEVREVLSYLRDRGMIAGFDKEEKAWIEVKGRGPDQPALPLRVSSTTIWNHTGWSSAGVTISGRARRLERDWLKNIRGLGARMYRKGEIRRAEALSQSNYQSAIRYLQDVNIITVTEVPGQERKNVSPRDTP